MTKNFKWVEQKMQDVEQKLNEKYKMVEKMQGGRAKAKQKMREGGAKKCKMPEQKLNKTCGDRAKTARLSRTKM
jgi:hypothetical protein